MKKYFSIIMIAAAIMACAKEQNVPKEKELQSSLVPLTFTGYADDGLTKTTLGEGFSIIWSEDDDITVFPGGNHFDVSGTSHNGLIATFNGEGSVADTYYALSPEQAGATISDGKITATLPTEQTATENSYDPAANISVAVADNYEFKFKNVGALIAVKVNEEGITKIRLEALSEGDQLAGPVKVDPNNSGNIIDGGRLDNTKNYVDLSGTFNSGSTYYFIILPGRYKSGFRITFYKGSSYASFTKGEDKSIGRNDNFTIGSFPDDYPTAVWKTLFTDGDELYIRNSKEAGQEVSYVGGSYWNTSVNSDLSSYLYTYEIFTELTGGQTFHFQSEGGERFSLSSDGEHIKRIANSKLAEYSAPDDGVYRIRMNLTTGVAEIRQITQVSHYQHGRDPENAQMTYYQHGEWFINNFCLGLGSKDYDDRYKFRFTFKNLSDNSSTTEEYGRRHSETGNPSAYPASYYHSDQNDASYFFVQPNPGLDNWDRGFKYAKNADSGINYEVQGRYYVRLGLDMNNARGQYTHTITSIWDIQNPLTAGQDVKVYGSAVTTPDTPGVKMRYSTSFYNSYVEHSGDRVDKNEVMAKPAGYNYEIFVQLTKESKFYFTAFTASSGHHFAINQEGTAIEGIFTEDDIKFGGVGEDGVYRIRINSSTNEVTILRAESARYEQPDRGTVQDLAYQGNGVWKGFPPFGWTHPKAWGNSERFKFKFLIYFNATTTWQYYGRYETAASYSSTHLQPLTDTYNIESWYNFLTVENDPVLGVEAYQVEYGYCDVYLKLNSDGYTYVIDNIR